MIMRRRKLDTKCTPNPTKAKVYDEVEREARKQAEQLLKEEQTKNVALEDIIDELNDESNKLNEIMKTDKRMFINTIKAKDKEINKLNNIILMLRLDKTQTRYKCEMRGINL